MPRVLVCVESVPILEEHTSAMRVVVCVESAPVLEEHTSAVRVVDSVSSVAWPQMVLVSRLLCLPAACRLCLFPLAGPVPLVADCLGSYSEMKRLSQSLSSVRGPLHSFSINVPSLCRPTIQRPKALKTLQTTPAALGTKGKGRGKVCPCLSVLLGVGLREGACRPGSLNPRDFLRPPPKFWDHRCQCLGG